MKKIQNVLYGIGKLWMAIILFAAMIVSTIIAAPFMIASKLSDYFGDKNQFDEVETPGIYTRLKPRNFKF